MPKYKQDRTTSTDGRRSDAGHGIRSPVPPMTHLAGGVGNWKKFPGARFFRRHCGILLIMPACLLVACVTVYPLYFAISYSFLKTEIWHIVRFDGLQNYIHLFADERFRTNLIATVIFVGGGVVLAIAIGVMLALALRNPTFTSKMLRTVIVIPWLMSEVVGGIIWRWLLNVQYGPFTYIAEVFGLTFPNIIGTPASALATVTLINVWRSVAFPTLMALAALQSVPKEIEEAAAVDGATKMQTAIFVLIPAITPVLLVTAIVLTISYLNHIVAIIALTGGGPMSSTEVLGVRLYREAFEYFNVGLASALSVVMLAGSLGLSYLYFRILHREE